ncbi:MAG: zinc-binding dehydrogenase, partial [Planctomycetota bacterium]
VDSKTAGPLFCGGITVFNPLVQFGIEPTASVAVIGIGGLGHLALQFAHAWGCHVTAFTSSESKVQEAKELGAHDTLNSRDPKALEEAAGRFDLILCTVNVKLDWGGLLGTLKPRGRLHLLGVQTEPVELPHVPMLFGQLSVSSSPVGSPGTIAKMISMCARHDIKPVTEHFPFDKVNEALEHLEHGKPRYRVVLDA